MSIFKLFETNPYWCLTKKETINLYNKFKSEAEEIAIDLDKTRDKALKSPESAIDNINRMNLMNYKLGELTGKMSLIRQQFPGLIKDI